LGGLFTCWALLQGGDTFRRYLAVSPSLWWDGKLLLDEKRAPAGELGPAGIYLAIGEHESDLLTAWPALDAAEAEIFGGLNMVADMRDFAARLRRHPGLAVTTEVIPDEHHCTVWGAAVTRGIVNLYRNDES
jgi:predicted alpha/beta superfamily hydrolase